MSMATVKVTISPSYAGPADVATETVRAASTSSKVTVCMAGEPSVTAPAPAPGAGLLMATIKVSPGSGMPS